MIRDNIIININKNHRPYTQVPYTKYKDYDKNILYKWLCDEAKHSVYSVYKQILITWE